MHNFFDALPPEIREAIDAVSAYKTVAEGEMVLRCGAPTGRLFQVCEGSVMVCVSDHQGRESVAAFLKAGDWIGLSEMFTGLPSMSDVVATAPSRLRTIKQPDFDALLDRFPTLTRELLRVMSLRFALMYYVEVDRNALTLKERVLKTLYMLSFSHGKRSAASTDIVIEMSQEALSKLLGASRQNLNRALKELEREQLLAVGYGAIHLPGLEAIRQHYPYLVDVAQPAPAYGGTPHSPPSV